jgi:ABC-type ATPase involved in cell division
MLRRVPPEYVQLFGTDIGAASEHEIAALRRRVRVIFQRHYLLRSLTVLQNVMIGIAAGETSSPGWNRTRAITFLENVGLAEHMQKWPDHLSATSHFSLVRRLSESPRWRSQLTLSLIRGLSFAFA